MIDLPKLRAVVKSAEVCREALRRHREDRRNHEPRFDEWWGPEDLQSAANDALEALPALLDEIDRLRAKAGEG